MTKRSDFIDWIYLVIAGLFECGWAIGIKYTEGFTKVVPSVLTIILIEYYRLLKIMLCLMYIIYLGDIDEIFYAYHNYHDTLTSATC